MHADNACCANLSAISCQFVVAQPNGVDLLRSVHVPVHVVSKSLCAVLLVFCCFCCVQYYDDFELVG